LDKTLERVKLRRETENSWSIVDPVEDEYREDGRKRGEGDKGERLDTK
jgi:hypothetical protein